MWLNSFSSTRPFGCCSQFQKYCSPRSLVCYFSRLSLFGECIKQYTHVCIIYKRISYASICRLLSLWYANFYLEFGNRNSRSFFFLNRNVSFTCSISKTLSKHGGKRFVRFYFKEGVDQLHQWRGRRKYVTLLCLTCVLFVLFPQNLQRSNWTAKRDKCKLSANGKYGHYVRR